MEKHRPPHIILEGKTIYFISGKTYGGVCHLAKAERKETFKKILFEKAEKFDAEINIWVVLSNHYHLLIKLAKGSDLPVFVRELHGSSSFAIKKMPAIKVLNEEQIILREMTQMEKRTEERVNEFWRRLLFASTPVVAGFSPRQKEVINEFGFSSVTKEGIIENERGLKSAITQNDRQLFKVIVFSCMPEIPFWCNYYSHVVRDERDFYMHFNYIAQNPLKHRIVKNLWKYPFSGVFDYERRYVLDCLRGYPIVDFGGSYD